MPSQVIRSRTTKEQIIAGIALNCVITCSTEEDVITPLTLHTIIAIATVDCVAAFASFGAVAGCVGNSRGCLRPDDGIASGGEVNHALGGQLTEALPAIDLAHADLT